MIYWFLLKLFIFKHYISVRLTFLVEFGEFGCFWWNVAWLIIVGLLFMDHFVWSIVGILLVWFLLVVCRIVYSYILIFLFVIVWWPVLSWINVFCCVFWLTNWLLLSVLLLRTYVLMDFDCCWKAVVTVWYSSLGYLFFFGLSVSYQINYLIFNNNRINVN